VGCALAILDHSIARVKISGRSIFYGPKYYGLPKKSISAWFKFTSQTLFSSPYFST